MPTFTPVTTDKVKTVGQHDEVHTALEGLPDYARNACCAYALVGRALRRLGWDFAEEIDPNELTDHSGHLELELSTMWGDGVAGVLYLQWNSNSRRAGEITFNVFIN